MFVTETSLCLQATYQKATIWVKGFHWEEKERVGKKKKADSVGGRETSRWVLRRLEFKQPCWLSKVCGVHSLFFSFLVFLCVSITTDESWKRGKARKTTGTLIRQPGVLVRTIKRCCTVFASLGLWVAAMKKKKKKSWDLGIIFLERILQKIRIVRGKKGEEHETNAREKHGLEQEGRRRRSGGASRSSFGEQETLARAGSRQR